MHKSILRSKEKDIQKSQMYSVLISLGNMFFYHMDAFKGAFSYGSIMTPQWINKGFLSSNIISLLLKVKKPSINSILLECFRGYPGNQGYVSALEIL